jgi:hypothetical protein
MAQKKRDGIPPDGGVHIAQSDAPTVEKVEVQRVTMVMHDHGDA